MKVRHVYVTLSLDGSKLKAEVNYGDSGKPLFTNKKTPPPNSSTGDSGIGFLPVLLMLLSLLIGSTLIFTRRRHDG